MKPFIDYLPDWIDEINLSEPSAYKYQYAIEVFNRIVEAQKAFPHARDFGLWVVIDKLDIDPIRKFACWRNSEHPRWTPDIYELFPRANERIDFDPIVIKGLSYWKFRYSIGVNVLEPYAPESPEATAKRKEAKQAKQRQAEIDSMPLFSIDIRAEQEKEFQ